MLSALVLTTVQLARFSRLWANFPPGLSIASVPVGGLNRQEAAQRLLQVYTLPVELYYNDTPIQLTPTAIGLELDLDSMLAAADMERTRQSFWDSFWNDLWNRPTQPADIPLRLTYSEDRLRIYLESEVAPRYDQPPSAPVPIAGTVNFQPGSLGTELDVDRAVLLIESALRSTTQRSVVLPLQRTSPPGPTISNLEVLIRQTIDLSGFDGVLGLYFQDLQTGEEISFNLDQDATVPFPPDVAFTASSTIKIPIMVSIFRRLGEDFDEETHTNLEQMIAKSINPASDWLMANVLDQVYGPLSVTEDVHTLGLDDTFLAGYFAPSAPLLQRFSTSANQRPDVVTEPDPYNQTTASEMGELLADIYQCSKDGGGTLIAAYPGEITQAECQTMVNYLIQDRIALLIQAGVPDGTNVAHKHGWVTDSYYIIHDMSDAAIVFSPGGDYVLTIYMYHPVQIVFDPANELVKEISRAIYNFYNIP